MLHGKPLWDGGGRSQKAQKLRSYLPPYLSKEFLIFHLLLQHADVFDRLRVVLVAMLDELELRPGLEVTLWAEVPLELLEGQHSPGAFVDRLLFDLDLGLLFLFLQRRTFTILSSFCSLAGLVTNSILFSSLFTIKDQFKEVRF